MEVVHGDDGRDADVTNQSFEEGSDHDIIHENIDFVIEGQNCFALENDIMEDNEAEWSDLIGHLLLLPFGSPNSAVSVIAHSSVNELTMEVDEENVSHLTEDINFQLQKQRLDGLVPHDGNDGGEAD